MIKKFLSLFQKEDPKTTKEILDFCKEEEDPKATKEIERIHNEMRAATRRWDIESYIQYNKWKPFMEEAVDSFEN